MTALDLASDAARVTLEDGSVLTAQLVVAADGKQSALRRMAGIAAREFGYRQTAIVCTVTHEQPHHGVAHEHFLPAGPFAMLPMTDETLRRRDACGIAPRSCGRRIRAWCRCC